MPFDSPDLNLGDLLQEVGSGKIRLPDFQRDWKWDTDRIAGLLASVSLGYPGRRGDAIGGRRRRCGVCHPVCERCRRAES